MQTYLYTIFTQKHQSKTALTYLVDKATTKYPLSSNRKRPLEQGGEGTPSHRGEAVPLRASTNGNTYHRELSCDLRH